MNEYETEQALRKGGIKAQVLTYLAVFLILVVLYVIVITPVINKTNEINQMRDAQATIGAKYAELSIPDITQTAMNVYLGTRVNEMVMTAKVDVTHTAEAAIATAAANQ